LPFDAVTAFATILHYHFDSDFDHLPDVADKTIVDYNYSNTFIRVADDRTSVN